MLIDAVMINRDRGGEHQNRGGSGYPPKIFNPFEDVLKVFSGPTGKVRGLAPQRLKKARNFNYEHSNNSSDFYPQRGGKVS